jgi:hypothetical protein
VEDGRGRNEQGVKSVVFPPKSGADSVLHLKRRKRRVGGKNPFRFATEFQCSKARILRASAAVNCPLFHPTFFPTITPRTEVSIYMSRARQEIYEVLFGFSCS